MRAKRSIALATAAVICACWHVSRYGDRAAEAATMTVPQAVKTPTPPAVAAGQTKSGVELKGSSNKKTRLESSSKPAKKKAQPAKSQSNPTPPPPIQRPKAPLNSRRDFRLNIGICGLRQPDGTTPGPNRCQPFEPDTPDPAAPTQPPTVVQPRPEDITWDQVFAETRNVAFPGLTVKVQPAGRTLVNLETIVYTDQSRVTTARVTLLGFPVEVEATPMSYLWRFGDGASLSTTTPGRPYPAKEITHKYLKKGSVGLTLTTNYAARFRVAGGAWQYVEGTVPITGPATPLQVREAVPVLVDPER